MKMINRTLTGALIATLIGAGTILPLAANASEQGRKNTTLGLGAATGYFLLKKQWVPALLAGAGTYAAQKNWQASINARHRQQHQISYLHSYDTYANSRPAVHSAAIRVLVNGSRVNFRGQPPMMERGHTLVPLRGVFEALGGDVQWDPAYNTVTVTRGPRTVKLGVNHRYAFVDNNQVAMDEPARMVNNSVMVPLRFISQALGDQVSWSNATQTVRIHSA